MGRYLIYTTYKDTEVEWLGRIPVEWKLMSFNRGIDFLTDYEANGSFALMKENVELDTSDNYAWYLRATDLENKRYGFVSGNRTCDEKTYNFLSKTRLLGGELLVAKRGEIGKVYIVPKLETKATLAPNLYLIRLNEQLFPVYVYYWFQSLFGRPQLELANKSTTIGALYKDDIKSCLVLYPSMHEQQAIARFLDYKTAQIDALIAKKETLLAKLAAKRTALISHAVTKGLDPTVLMKDSGVEWLGEVPSHWNVIKIRYCTEFVTSGPRGWSQYFSDAGRVFLRIANVTRLGIDLRLQDIQRVSAPEGAESERTIACPGDVIVSITADLGSVAVIPNEFENAYVSQHLALLRPLRDKASGRWIAYQVFSYPGKAQLLGSGYGGTKIQLSLSDVKDLWVVLPPKQEQRIIETYLYNTTNSMHQMEDKIQAAINKLKDYRAALITNAVTGKIDVRNVPIPNHLPLEGLDAPGN